MVKQAGAMAIMALGIHYAVARHGNEDGLIHGGHIRR